MTLEISHWFPPEIVREILLKASVTSLLRCKSVCKEWYSLISDQHFIKSHYTLSSTNNIDYEHHRLIYNTYGYDQLTLCSCSLYDVLFDKSANNAIQLENPSQSVRIVGSCNGLLCLLVEDDNTLFTYNPSTRKTNILNVPKQWGYYGFGYDEKIHDYKVVKIGCIDLTLAYWGTMIYSLKAGSWKEIGHYPRGRPLDDGKFLYGALHWATGTDELGYQHIVSLDLGKETYGEVLQPEYDGKGYKNLTLGVLGESLCVLCNYCESCVVDVWVMKVYGVKDSWTKLACIPHPTKSWATYLDILCILKDGKVLLQFGRQLYVYDLKDSSLPEIVNSDEIKKACIVVESLVSPYHPLGLADNIDDEY